MPANKFSIHNLVPRTFYRIL